MQVDADREAEQKGANEYQRPEDVETGESTGKDRNNGGNTLYVAVTEGAEGGVIAVDLRSRIARSPTSTSGAGGQRGEPDFSNSDNLALDRKGNLAITEDPRGATRSGRDIWIAEPPRSGRPAAGASERRPLRVAEGLRRGAELASTSR